MYRSLCTIGGSHYNWTDLCVWLVVHIIIGQISVYDWWFTLSVSVRFNLFSCYNVNLPLFKNCHLYYNPIFSGMNYKSRNKLVYMLLFWSRSHFLTCFILWSMNFYHMWNCAYKNKEQHRCCMHVHVFIEQQVLI